MAEKRGNKKLYQMPDKIYKKNRKKSFHTFMLDISLTIFALFFAFLCIIFNGLIFILIFSIPLIIFNIVTIFKENNNIFKLNRFIIYENKYIPVTKPIIYYLKNEDYIVYFKDIEKIEYHQYGEMCVLFLKNSKKEFIKLDWKDIEGYITFSEILKKKFPTIKLPDFEIVRKNFFARIALGNNSISEEEYDKIFDQEIQINKDFI